MVDTRRTKADLTDNLYQDNQGSKKLTPARHRDHIVSSVHSRITTEQGVVDYNDTATAGTPITLTAATPTKLTNDKLGSFTNTTYLPDTITDLWDTTGNQLDFTETQLGDKILLRIDVSLTTLSPDTDMELSLDVAIGGTPYSLNIARQAFKSAGTYPVVGVFPVYMGDTNTKSNPAEIIMETDKNSTVIVNGWAIFIN